MVYCIKKLLISLVFSLGTHQTLWCRSPHRPLSPNTPCVSASWVGDATSYDLYSPHLKATPIFSLFDKDYFFQHLLPSTSVPYRDNPTKTFETTRLSSCIEELIQEINLKKKQYKHFEVLQDKDFNRRMRCGLLVVRFKEFPLVVKIFIENPKSFAQPLRKGFAPIFFFYMGHGVGRHMAGFTRIKNLEIITTKLAQNPVWASSVTIPRKWFWLPKDPQWIELKGAYITEVPQVSTIIPGIYAIIADEIIAKRKFSIHYTDDKERALALCNYLDLYVDPHIDNFMIEAKTGNIAIVDTEHFPTIVGLKKKCTITSYFNWYTTLMGKCAQDMIFCTKQSLLSDNLVPSELALT